MRLEVSNGASNKFWEIEVRGSTHTVSYGRIGTSGQSKTKEFADPAAAQKDADKLIAAKKKKGYVEAASDTEAPVGAEESANLADATVSTKPVERAVSTTAAATVGREADSQATIDSIRQQLEDAGNVAAFVAALERAGNLQDPRALWRRALVESNQRIHDACTGGELADGRAIIEAYVDAYAAGQDEARSGEASQNLASNSLVLTIMAKDDELQALVLDRLVPPVVTDPVLAFNLACMCAHNQDTDGLFKFMDLALSLGKIPAEFQNDSDFAPYLEHPEFQRILAAHMPADLQAIIDELEGGAPFSDRHLGELATLWFPAEDRVHDESHNQVADIVRKYGDDKSKEIFAGRYDFVHKGRLFRWICERAPEEVFLRALRPLGDSLHFNDSRVRRLPAAIAKLRYLKHISILDGFIQEFPDALLELENLESLNLYASKIPELPPGIARWQKLERLELERNRLTRLPPEIGSLRALERLDLRHNKLEDVAEELCECPALISARFTENPGIPGTDLTNLFERFGKDGTPVPLRKLQLALVLDKLERAQEIATLPMLVTSLNAASRVIRANALRCIEAMQGAVSLPDGARVAMVGKLQGKASVWKKRLADAGFTRLARHDPSADAVVLGEKVGELDLEGFQGVVLVENTLKKILDGVQTPYLEDTVATPAAATENLAELLDSSDPANQKLALELMTTGGAPDNVMMSLFGAAFLSSDARVRKSAKALLTKHAGLELQRKLAGRVSFLNVATEKKMSSYIDDFAEAPEVDAMDLARRVFRATGKGKKYLFEHAESGEHAEIWRRLMGQATGSSLEGVSTAVEVAYSDLETLPDIFDALPEITHLSVHGNVLSELPPSLFRLPNLVWLELSGNKLKRLPDEIRELSGLTHLALQGNQLRTLPDSICELHDLEELELWGNKLKRLPKGLGSLAKLTKLRLVQMNMKAVPRELFEMEQLEELSLSYNELDDLPEEISALSRLRSLDLNHNKFRSIPEPVTELTGLESLELSFNQLESIPETIQRLTALTDLDLAANRKIKGITPSELQALLPDCKIEQNFG